MRPEERIESTIRNLEMEIDHLTDQTVLNELLEAHAQSRQAASCSVDRREITMTWKLTNAAAVAALLIVAAVGVYHFTGSVDGAQAAWGSVQKHFAKVDRVRFIKLTVGPQAIKPVYEGWHADGKTVYRDHTGDFSYDDG